MIASPIKRRDQTVFEGGRGGFVAAKPTVFDA